MSQLLDRAVAEARKLPGPEQDAIAAIILEEIQDERLWDEAFARSPAKLAAMKAALATGLKITIIARQFGVSLAALNKALNNHRK